MSFASAELRRIEIQRLHEFAATLPPEILVNALQDTVHQDVANGNVKRGAALPKRESVAETPRLEEEEKAAK